MGKIMIEIEDKPIYWCDKRGYVFAVNIYSQDSKIFSFRIAGSMSGLHLLTNIAEILETIMKRVNVMEAI